MQSAIVAKDVTVLKQGQPVLNNVTCEVKPSTLTGLIGPSGSGKTTLMRSIIGAQQTTHGLLTVNNFKAGSKQLRSQIGYVTQSPAIYDDLTVSQNLAYFAAIINVSKVRVQEVITMVDLQAQTRQLGSTLSGGQRARVSLAIALLGNAPILVLDEPTVGLDPLLRQDLWRLFAQLAHTQGHTILVSSHVMDEAERCDDLLLLRDGSVLFEGSKQTLLQQTTAKNVEAAFLQLIQKGQSK